MTVVHGPIDDPAAVRAIAQRATTQDGIDPLSEQFLLGLDGPGPHIVVAGGYAGVVVPPAGGPGAVEAVVDPAHRGQGVGRALIQAALAEAGDGATVWAHGDLPAACAVAAHLALTPARTLLAMRRALAGPDAAPLTVPTPSDGVRVRTYAGPGDDAAILAVNNAAFAWHPEQGGWTQEQIDERTGAEWFDPQGLFLAVDADDRLLGFHWTKVADPGAGLGEVYVVAVAPEGQGHGLGRLLTATGLRYLADRGLSDVELYVEGDNTAALRTYETLGFSIAQRHVAYA